MDEVYENGLRIQESEIIKRLLPDIRSTRATDVLQLCLVPATGTGNRGHIGLPELFLL